jgi:hypothetical protein
MDPAAENQRGLICRQTRNRASRATRDARDDCPAEAWPGDSGCPDGRVAGSGKPGLGSNPSRLTSENNRLGRVAQRRDRPGAGRLSWARDPA